MKAKCSRLRSRPKIAEETRADDDWSFASLANFESAPMIFSFPMGCILFGNLGIHTFNLLEKQEKWKWKKFAKPWKDASCNLFSCIFLAHIHHLIPKTRYGSGYDFYIHLVYIITDVCRCPPAYPIRGPIFRNTLHTWWLN